MSDPTCIERLSRAVCVAWGWDPDRRHVLAGGLVCKLWQCDRVNDTVTAFIAMTEADRAAAPAGRPKREADPARFDLEYIGDAERVARLLDYGGHSRAAIFVREFYQPPYPGDEAGTEFP